ncbi:MAG: hypothetical protein MUO64_01185 [Anaerolineales bacterium]|nr:hypothetical protein [Anaerolineales bacterium]
MMKKDASKALVIAGIALFFTLTCGIAPSLTILPQIFPVLNQINPFATITLIFIGFFIGIWVIATWVIAPWLKKPPGKPRELQEIRHLLAQGKRPAAKQKVREVTRLEEYQLDAYLDALQTAPAGVNPDEYAWNAAFQVDEPASESASSAPEASKDWLPVECPHCGGGISTNTVQWVNSSEAKCPYCGGYLKA